MASQLPSVSHSSTEQRWIVSFRDGVEDDYS